RRAARDASAWVASSSAPLPASRFDCGPAAYGARRASLMSRGTRPRPVQEHQGLSANGPERSSCLRQGDYPTEARVLMASVRASSINRSCSSNTASLDSSDAPGTVGVASRMASESPPEQGRLRRELGVFGAVMMGLGSIVGTGVFVSLGVAAGIAGPAVLLAIVIGAFVASFNGLSSAQLAADHPVSGGTYEYGYRYLRPWLGFLAGVTFLLAKSASAATAALGFAGYLLGLVGAPARWSVPLGVAAVAALTLVVLAGLRRSHAVNTAIVSATLLSLLAFVVAGAPAAVANGAGNLTPFFAPEPGASPLTSLLHASALMFVAFTGYGRIATLGEEVVAPRRTIPRAIQIALVVVALLYGLVALVGVGAVGAGSLARVEGRAAPLELAARSFGAPVVARVVAVG